MNKKIGFKPYFRWLAPYTNPLHLFQQHMVCSFKPYFRWLAPYTSGDGAPEGYERI